MDFKAEIEKLIHTGFEPDQELLAQKDSLYEIKESIARLNKKQMETSINIEEIQGLLLESLSDKADLLNALVSVIDYIDDFYCFAANDKSSPLFMQAQMMQSGIIKKTSAAGLVRIYDEGSLFDATYNEIEFMEESDILPNGYIIRTLRAGYAYHGEVIRKSKVVAAKNNENLNEVNHE